MPLDGREDECDEGDDDNDDKGGGDGTGDGIPMVNSPISVTDRLSAFSLLGGIDTGFCLGLDACFDNGFEFEDDDKGIATPSSPISVMINTGISFSRLSRFGIGPEPCFFFQLSHNELNDDSGLWKTGPGAM